MGNVPGSYGDIAGADPITAAFDQVGRALPGYRPRGQQLEYSRAVHDAFRDNARLVIEGPTGVGKSFGYLLPAVLSGRKTLVVTAGIQLQDQLFDKDLPFLAKHVRPFKYALVKGRSNYFCQNAAEEVETDAARTQDESALLAWGRHTTSGDRKESPAASPAAWRRISVSSDECLGSECGHRATCFALKALREAQEAQVVVANYHLLFAHLKVSAATGGAVSVLPAFDALVLDECHEAASIARGFFGFKLTAHAVRRLAQRAQSGYVRGEDTKDLLDASADFFSALTTKIRGLRGPVRFQAPNAIPEAAWTPLARELTEISHRLEDIASNDIDEPHHATAARKLARTAMQHAGEIKAAMSLGELSGSPAVYYLESEEGRPALYGKPLDVSREVSRAYPTGGPTILTSATVTVAGDFAPVMRELGVKEGSKQIDGAVRADGSRPIIITNPLRTLAVESPYDWKRQAAVIVPRIAEGDTRAQDAAIAEVVRRAKGRTLVLCTSNKRVREARDALSGCGYRVLAQGDMPLAQLVDEFREDVSSVLVGTTSLWKGVDVAGEALSYLVIDKLPFDVWTDPLVEARREHLGDEGWSTYVADAVIRFRQGVGRLIRSEADRGVVVLLDARVLSKPYGKKFLRSLPSGIGFSSDLGDVDGFLDAPAETS